MEFSFSSKLMEGIISLSAEQAIPEENYFISPQTPFCQRMMKN